MSELTKREKALAKDCKHCYGGGCCACLAPIPDGGTCEKNCAHVVRCQTLFGQKGTETCCQFIPSRFLAPIISRVP
jgi:hypothetical protein